MPKYDYDQTMVSKDRITGKLVKIEDVERGLSCDCVCPHCGMRMVANKGDKNRHYFCHERIKNSNIDYERCHMSIIHMYAEQIISDSKQVMCPSYYGIEKPHIIRFARIEREERTDRPDLQPDLVGITNEGMRILIEIKFSHAVDFAKTQKIFSDDLTCIEIDVSKQTTETLEHFLLQTADDRKWINNSVYFDSLGILFKNRQNLSVQIIPEGFCLAMITKQNCIHKVAVEGGYIVHKNMRYIICKYAQEKCYLKEQEMLSKTKAAEIKDDTPTSKPVSVYVTTKDNTPLIYDTPQNSINSLIKTEKGDLSKYPLLPESAYARIDDYYRNIERHHDTFCKDESHDYNILNHYINRRMNSFSVVVADKKSICDFYVIRVRKEGLFFIHDWFGRYSDENQATLSAKKML